MNHFVLLKNIIANILRGGASALVAVLLPPFLIRMMPSTTYGIWVLVLQLSAYVGYLDFGIQTAVGRFVAYSNERNDNIRRDQIISTSAMILSGSACLGLLLIIGLSLVLPSIFEGIPSAFHQEAQLALLFVGISLAVGLPFSVFGGIFIGLQRYEIPALIIGLSKLIGALLVVGVAWAKGGLVYMALTLASVNFLSYIVQFWASRRLANDIKISFQLVSMQTAREIFGYCFSLSVWSFSMLLISGLDTTIVGIVDFPSLPYYSMAITLVVFIGGLQTAAFSVLMPTAAVLDAKGDAVGLGRLLVTSTRYGVLLLLFIGTPLAIFAKKIISIWVGNEYSTVTGDLLQILVCANVIRFSLSPYATLLVGTGQQRLIVISPLVEGFSNLLVSVIAGYWFGAVGVAVGTLVGSLIAYAMNLLYNMPKTKGIVIPRRLYLRDGVLRPLICAMPFNIWSVLFYTSEALSVWGSSSLLITSAITVVAVWFVGLLYEERKWLVFYTMRQAAKFA